MTRRRPLVLTLAAVIPLVACGVLALVRDSVANTNAALVLVLLVVAAASTGVRPAGIVAALSSAVWFDFFLTEPYQRFTITDRADIETTVLLALVGAAVTELALWGRRQQARASRQEGYLAGIVSAARAVATGSSPPTLLVEHVARQITDVLDIDGCRFDDAPGEGFAARLNRDGTVDRAGHAVDVERNGLPIDDEIELLAEAGGSVRGRFLLTASTRVARPDLEQRLVAITLADQVGAALTTRPGAPNPTQP
ncbi:MAG TPA: DUF4118 domain-containing protein [Jiangellaceae bacterium]